MRKGIITAAIVVLAIIAPATATACPIELSEQEAERVSYCTDGLPVYRDSITGTLYGDQDGNGVLDGTDCDWT